jgi:hypothetical protein
MGSVFAYHQFACVLHVFLNSLKLARQEWYVNIL